MIFSLRLSGTTFRATHAWGHYAVKCASCLSPLDAPSCGTHWHTSFLFTLVHNVPAPSWRARCWKDTCLYTKRKERRWNRTTAARRTAEKVRPICAVSCARRPSAQKLHFITISVCIRTSSRAARYGRSSARSTSSSNTPHPPPRLWSPAARVKQVTT